MASSTAENLISPINRQKDNDNEVITFLVLNNGS